MLDVEEWTVAGRIRLGSLADVPWIAIFPAASPAGAQSGYYLVYLFAKDGSRTFLSLNQGTEKVRGGTAALTKRVLDMRSVVGTQDGLEVALDLRSTNTAPKKYEAGSAFAIEYWSGQAVSDEQLRLDLERMLGLLRQLLQSGLDFHPETEPLHLLFKWNTTINRRTIEDHQSIADEHGSVWWGRFASATTSNVSETKIAELQRQLDQGFETSAFLYRRGKPGEQRSKKSPPAAITSAVTLIPQLLHAGGVQFFRPGRRL